MSTLYAPGVVALDNCEFANSDKATKGSWPSFVTYPCERRSVMELKFLHDTVSEQEKGFISHILADMRLEPIRVLEHQLKGPSSFSLDHPMKLGHNSVTAKIVSDPLALSAEPVSIVAQQHHFCPSC